MCLYLNVKRCIALNVNLEVNLYEAHASTKTGIVCSAVPFCGTGRLAHCTCTDLPTSYGGVSKYTERGDRKKSFKNLTIRGIK